MATEVRELSSAGLANLLARKQEGSVRIGLLGCGTVGSEVARTLTARTGGRQVLRRVAVAHLDKPRSVALSNGVLTAEPKRLGPDAMRGCTKVLADKSYVSWEEGETWRAQAACSGRGYEMFFPESDTRGNEVAEKAAEVCRSCEVSRECLDFAVATNQKHGIWGGLTTSERLLEKRRRSRKPRRDRTSVAL